MITVETLQHFCATADVRFYLNHPLPVAGGAAASDGSIMIFAQGLEVEPSAGVTKGTAVVVEHLERLVRAVDEHSDAEGWIDASTIELGSQETCLRCMGSGFVTESDCPDCDGEGEFQHGSHWYDCKECEGAGASGTSPSTADIAHAIRCFECRSTGINARPMPFPGLPPGRSINSRYMISIQKHLPSARMKVIEHPGTKGTRVIAIRFDGGCGVVLPMQA